MIPGRYPLVLYRGDTYQWRAVIWLDGLRTQPFDLSTSTAKAEIRDEPAGRDVYDINCTIILPNTVDLYIPSAVSQQLPEKGVWDLQLSIAGGIGFGPNVQTILRGEVSVITDVTESTGRVHVSPAVPLARTSGLTAFPKRGRAA